MSASKEKKKRLDVDAGTEKLSYKHREEMEENAKFRKKTKIVVIVFAVFAIIVILFSSNLFYRHFSAVEVNGEKFSVCDFNYYYYKTYYSYYNTYYNYYGDSAKDYMPGTSEIETEAKSSIQSTAMLHKEAVANGYSLTEEDQQEIDSAISSIASGAEQNGSTLDKYITMLYGKGMTEKILRKNLEYYQLAYSYYNVVYNSFEYSESELQDYYAENKDSYDVISYRMFSVSATDTSTSSSDTTSTTDTTAATVTDEEASNEAYEFYNQITDEQSFINLAYQYAPEDSKSSYEDADYTLVNYDGKSIQNYFSVYSDWLLDSGRHEGDTTVIGSGGTYYVLYFINRDSNDYPTVDVRQILISPDTVSESDYSDTDAYNAAVTEADNTAKSKADEVYQEWQSGDATEDSFAALADEYSSDTSSAGGLYEHVYKNQMVSVFNDWIFDSTRQPGDTTIVHSDNYGYHIIYFIGEDMKYCDYLADKDKRQSDYEDWVNNRIDNYDVVTTWLLWLAQ